MIDTKKLEFQPEAIKKANDFWQWFSQNKEQFIFKDKSQDHVNEWMDVLIEKLKLSNEELVAEIGGGDDTYTEIVISAGGIRDAFADAHTLVLLAPEIKGWLPIPLKLGNPAGALQFKFKFPNFELGANDISFVPIIDEEDIEKICIKVISPLLKDKENEGHIANAIFIMMDHLLGEASVTLDFEVVSFETAALQNEKPLPFEELPNFLSYKKKERRNSGVQEPAESYTMYEWEKEDGKMLITANTGMSYFEFKNDFPMRIEVAADFTELANTADENDEGWTAPLFDAQDYLQEILQKNKTGFFVLAETESSIRTMVFYTNDAYILDDAIATLNKKNTNIHYTITKHFDPYWINVSEFVK